MLLKISVELGGVSVLVLLEAVKGPTVLLLRLLVAIVVVVLLGLLLVAILLGLLVAPLLLIAIIVGVLLRLLLVAAVLLRLLIATISRPWGLVATVVVVPRLIVVGLHGLLILLLRIVGRLGGGVPAVIAPAGLLPGLLIVVVSRLRRGRVALIAIVGGLRRSQAVTIRLLIVDIISLSCLSSAEQGDGESGFHTYFCWIKDILF